MRWIVGCFGIVGAAVVVVVVARYGFRTADTEADGYITAAMFSFIAVGGLVGPAVATRMWGQSKIWSGIIGLAALGALVLNFTNSLGFIAGRGDTKQAEIIKLRDKLLADKTALHRLMRQHESLPRFAQTGAASVATAREAVSAAVAVRQAECRRRGSRCRKREADEKAARASLVEVDASRALTIKATALEAKIEALQARISTARPITSANPQANQLALVFSISAAKAATYQPAAAALIVEVLIAVFLVAFEFMGRPSARIRQAASLTTSCAPDRIMPSKPRLVSVSKPAGDVAKILTHQMEPAKGKRIEVEDAYRVYRQGCDALDQAPLQAEAFLDALQRLCAACEIDMKSRGKNVYLENVRLAA